MKKNSSIQTQTSEIINQPFDFKKQKRLITAKDYKVVFDNVSFKIHQPHLFCLVTVQAKNSDITAANKIPHSRLGLAISKAKNKHAHERNRIKRLIREYFRLNQHKLADKVDMVFMVKRKTDQLSNEQIYQELQQCWSKINHKLNK